MIEKVNPEHPDKIADRISGAIVDLAYKKDKNPKIAVEILIGHGNCYGIIETNTTFNNDELDEIVTRITKDKTKTVWNIVKQDEHLADNQKDTIKCGDNGIFKGMPLTDEEKELSKIAKKIYNQYKSDGKYILDGKKLIICQSYASEELSNEYPAATINPLGYWTGGTNVDTGATNRKLGSDMGHSITGGGLHGKDLSKADVSLNIYAFLKAQETGKPVQLSCAIGDEIVDNKKYSEIVEIAKKYIKKLGGFEKLAEWGLF